MSIWTYVERIQDRPDYWRDRAHTDRNFGFSLQDASTCVFCSSVMRTLAGDALPAAVCKGMSVSHRRVLLGCPSCGWWSAYYLDAGAPYETYDGGYAELRQSVGVLKELDPSDLSVPVDELRSYLAARYEGRFDVHPRKYEEIVAGVFADFGYRVRVTSYSGDEGIDVFVLEGNNNATAGVQVKRYRRKITAEQIRAFLGALVLQGLTTGIHVTTSSYQRGAVRAAKNALQQRGIAVNLIDAPRFYDALHITTRTTHPDPDDRVAPYFRAWHDIEHAPTIWGSSW